MRGSFICIEGPDGSGKGEQSERLVSRLKAEGFEVVSFDFPQYGETFFGDMVGEMLAGGYGPMENINPHLASLPYAFDRWQASGPIKRELSKGKIAVANRFTFSNLAHQTARMPFGQREDFIKFILKLENEILGIPTPDLSLHLDVPVEISQKLIAGKLQRKYLRDGNFDLLEKDLNHQIEASRMYRELSSRMQNMFRINCCDEAGNLKSIAEIHEIVWNKTVEHLHNNLEGQKTGKER